MTQSLGLKPASLWWKACDHTTAPSLLPRAKGKMDHSTFLGNPPPTPPLTQHFATYYHLEQNVGLGEGWVGVSQPQLHLTYRHATLFWWWISSISMPPLVSMVGSTLMDWTKGEGCRGKSMGSGKRGVASGGK